MGEDNERASTARQNGWKTVTGKHCPTKWFEVLSGQSPATPCGWSARQKWRASSATGQSKAESNLWRKPKT